MDFEQELRKRLREKEIQNLNDFKCRFLNRTVTANVTKDIMQKFMEIIEIFYSKKYEHQKTEQEIIKLMEHFGNLLKDKNLGEMYSKTEFSKEEILYIKYVKLTNRWRGREIYTRSEEYAIREILLRRIIIEQFSKEDIDEITKIMHEILKENDTRLTNTSYYFIKLLSENPYELQLEEKVEAEIDKKTDKSFNDAINCGGYALKIDEEVFPFPQSKSFAEDVSTIMERYPFVRLLGDTKLKEDEYLVIYRSTRNYGHHFIRVDDDGIVREKESANPPGIFNGWSDVLKDSEEAIFAVKKEHKMFGYDRGRTKKNGLDFEDTVIQALTTKNNNFTYHGHEFSLKKSSRDEIFVISDNSIVANILTDGDDYLIEKIDEKQSYIENFSGKIKPIIKNGHLINMKDFIENKEKTEEIR